MTAASSIVQAKTFIDEISGKKAKRLLSLVRLRDPNTGGHCNRVRLLARKVCEQLRLSPGETATIVMASCLHDIGKIGMPDAILRKPAPLTPEERAIMNTHPYEGWNILKHIDGFAAVAEMSHHHEWYDDGYPDGLRGEQISLGQDCSDPRRLRRHGGGTLLSKSFHQDSRCGRTD